MATATQSPEPPQESPNEPTTVSRLRSVTGSRWPRKFACGCGSQIPRGPEIRYVVDFGASKPYPTYLREQCPDYGTYGSKPRAEQNTTAVPAFRPASDLPREPPRPPAAPRPTIGVAHKEADATPSPEAGRPDHVREARFLSPQELSFADRTRTF